eukprot:TRINITY_DN1624_c0_g1_i1.p1 TRINITY_DN1624_c0_g1~~TRINITY_DN1624_c0_g1_i1.p1  ORF type:complete len:185 (-),score=43.26 TRINITY_DN1624_c0_g1_i1:145-699(-)
MNSLRLVTATLIYFASLLFLIGTTEGVKNGKFCQTNAQGEGYVMGSYFAPSFIDDDNTFCTLLWFKGWTLNTPGKYAAAVVGLFFMGFFNEALVRVRSRVSRYTGDGFRGRSIRGFLYGLQLFNAYLLMLVVMTYEIILFLSLLLGLSVGYGLFSAPVAEQVEDEKKTLLKKPSGSTPCCGGND